MALRNLPKEEAIKSLSGIFNRDSQINGFNTSTLLSGPITPNQKQEKSSADSRAMQLMLEKAEAAKDNEKNQSASTGFLSDYDTIDRSQYTLSIPELHSAYKLNPNSKVAKLLEQALIEKKYSDLKWDAAKNTSFGPPEKNQYANEFVDKYKGFVDNGGYVPPATTNASAPSEQKKEEEKGWLERTFPGLVQDYAVIPQTKDNANSTTDTLPFSLNMEGIIRNEDKYANDNSGAYFSETDEQWNPYVNASEGQRFTAASEYMTPEERSNYLSLMQADVLSGKYTGNAEKYKDSLDLTSRMLQKKIEARKDDSYISKIGTAIEAGLSDFAGGITDFGRMMNGQYTSDLNHMFDYDYAATRESIGDDVGKFFFDLTRTSVRNAASQVFGIGAGSGASIAYSIISGAGSAGSAYNQSLQEGHTKEEAMTYGIISGLSETLLEYASGAGRLFGGTGVGAIDKLKQTVFKNSWHPLKKFIAAFGLDAIGEAGEEYLQALGEKMFRNIAYGEHNKYKLSDFVSEEALYNALLGAMSGGMMGSVSNSIKILENSNKYKYSQVVKDTAKAAGFTDTDAVNKVANWAESTRTPVIFMADTFTDPMSGTQVNAVEAGGMVFISAQSKSPMLELAIHETAHTAQNTAQYQALLNEVKQSAKFAQAGSWENAVANFQ